MEKKRKEDNGLHILYRFKDATPFHWKKLTHLPVLPY